MCVCVYAHDCFDNNFVEEQLFKKEKKSRSERFTKNVIGGGGGCIKMK